MKQLLATVSASGAAVALAIVFFTTAAQSQGSTAQSPPPRNAEEFDRMFKEHSNWGRWGKDDERGAANLVTAATRKAAAALVKSGISVSLTHNPIAEQAADNQSVTFEHTMAPSFRTDTYRFTYHAAAVSHIDGLCHVAYNGMLYNGVPVSASSEKGCGKLGIQNLKNGMILRAVLIDIPRLKGVPYLEPSTPVHVQDIEAWEKKAGVKVSAGDAILLYTGRWARRAKVGPYTNRAGFHISVGPWLRARDVASIGSDGAGDVVPPPIEGVGMPFHTFVIAGLGINLLDNLDMEALADTAASLKRWELMLTIAPLPVTGGTGSPLNVLATF